MAKRHHMNKGYSRKLFTKTAGHNRVHPKNGLGSMTHGNRGGIRF